MFNYTSIKARNSCLLVVLCLAFNSSRCEQLSQDDKLLWGTYRPLQYVGLRARVPTSPLIGLMWYQPSAQDSLEQIRHQCLYADNLAKYGWEKHNAESYGLQGISDPANNMNLTVQWVKPDLDEDPNHWILRVEANSIDTDSSVQQDISLMWYVSTPGDQRANFDPSGYIWGEDTEGLKSKYYVQYISSESNEYPGYVDLRNQTEVFSADYFYALTVDENDYYDPKKYYYNEVKDAVKTVPPHLFDPSSLYRAETAFSGNMVVQQKFYKLPFTLDIHYNQNGQLSEAEMDMDQTSQYLKQAEQNFDATFDKIFVQNSSNQTKATDQNQQESNSPLEFERQLSDLDIGQNNWTDEQLIASKYALSNMLGSIAYMYGDRMIFNTSDGTVITQPQTYLFTGVPDRPDHGRGFMWDEGFHNHLISAWNINITQDIIASWFATTDTETGWVCREQMLGREVRSGAPPSSWPQISTAANPPSQHMLLDHLLDRFERDPELKEAQYDSFKLFLGEIYENFKLNVEWFLATQQSDVMDNTFRWKGRTLTYCLPSGMDDYPRAPILTDSEAHVDLQVWMIVSSRALSRVASVLNKTDDAEHYAQNVDIFTQVLLDNFWDEERQMFDDFYLDEAGSKQFEGHTGYLNFWPFFLDAIDPSDSRFKIVVSKLIDKDFGMWTSHGIRSLSINDEYYRLGDNYWTSPIWMNINYLIVTALYKYGQDERVQDHEFRQQIFTAYQELRVNLINMIVDSYTHTGYIWEVYSDHSGEGRDNHPFTGWSALFTNLLAQLY